MGFDLGVAIMNGCKNGKVLPPNIILRLGYSVSAFPGPNRYVNGKTSKTAVRGFSSFGVEYPEFNMGNGRVAFEPSLEIVPEVDLKPIGIPVSGSIPINLIFKGDLDDLKGYSVELEAAGKAGLVEQGPAKNDNDAEHYDPHLGPLGAAIDSLVETSTTGQDFIDHAAAQASRVLIERRSLMKRSTVAAATSVNQTGPLELPFDICASATFAFCLTVPKCFGQ